MNRKTDIYNVCMRIWNTSVKEKEKIITENIQCRKKYIRQLEKEK